MVIKMEQLKKYVEELESHFGVEFKNEGGKCFLILRLSSETEFFYGKSSVTVEVIYDGGFYKFLQFDSVMRTPQEVVERLCCEDVVKNS